jgi:hypothetical protein
MLEYDLAMTDTVMFSSLSSFAFSSSCLCPVMLLIMFASGTYWKAGSHTSLHRYSGFLHQHFQNIYQISNFRLVGKTLKSIIIIIIIEIWKKFSP